MDWNFLYCLAVPVALAWSVRLALRFRLKATLHKRCCSDLRAYLAEYAQSGQRIADEKYPHMIHMLSECRSCGEYMQDNAIRLIG